MPEGRADEHGSRNGPEKSERLAIPPAEGDANQAVEEEGTEDPRCKVCRGQTTAGPHRKNDRDRPGRREDEGHDCIDEIDAAEVGKDLARRGYRRTWAFERHPFGWGARLHHAILHRYGLGATDRCSRR